jgi:asparagine synthase (glutamine-hydrolysing)
MGHIIGIISTNDLMPGRMTYERSIAGTCLKSNLKEPKKSEISFPKAIVSFSCDKVKIIKTESGFVLFKGLLFESNVMTVSERFFSCRDSSNLRDIAADTDFEGIFVIYNAIENKIVLIRDRIGIGQLYWAVCNGNFYFSTRPDFIAVHPDVASEFNVEYTARYAASHYRYIDAKEQDSPFEKVNRVPAGSILSAQKDVVALEHFWRIKATLHQNKSEADLAEIYSMLLQSAVARRLAQSSNPAFLLSGGMDSSSVASCAWKHMGTGITAYSTVYSDSTYDESSEIQDMLNDRVKSWTPVALDSPNLVEVVQQMIACHGEPVCTSTWLSHFELSKKVAVVGHDVLFGGLGGDELNAGEFEYFPFFFADLQCANEHEVLNEEIARWAEYHNHPLYKKGRPEAEFMMTQYCDLNSPGKCKPNFERLLRYQDVINPQFFNLAEFVPAMPSLTDSYLTNRCYQDLILETAPCCVRSEQRHSDGLGFISTDPFLDYRVVEFMFSVPGRLKIKNGVTKHLLRSAMRGILPEETRTRVKKVGWNAPAHEWFLHGGMDAILELLPKEGVGLYVPERVKSLIKEHREIVENKLEKENHMMFLWQTLNMLCWRKYVRELRRELVNIKKLA